MQANNVRKQANNLLFKQETNFKWNQATKILLMQDRYFRKQANNLLFKQETNFRKQANFILLMPANNVRKQITEGTLENPSPNQRRA